MSTKEQEVITQEVNNTEAEPEIEFANTTIVIDGIRYNKETGEELGPGFSIDSPERAKWFALKLVGKYAKEAALIKQHQEDLEALRIDQEKFLNWFAAQAVEYAQRVRAENKGKGIVSFDAGAVAIVQKDLSFVLDKEAAPDALLNWALKENPELVKTITPPPIPTPPPFQEVDLNAVKRIAKEKQEALPGLKAVRPHIEATLTLADTKRKVKLTDYGLNAVKSEPIEEATDGV